LQLDAGLHVILGSEADGTGHLIELLSGVLRPRRGTLAFQGELPSASPRLRRRVASLLPREDFPARGSVQAWVDELAELRGVSASRVLTLSEVERSTARSMESLSSAERRRLALAVALAEADPLLVALHEPLAAASAISREAVLGRIHELAASTVVVVSTAAIADARQLGGTLHVLERGVLVREHGHAWPAALTPGLDVCISVDCDSPRELLAALAKSPEVQKAHYGARRGSECVELWGSDLERLASAIGRAAVTTRSNIRTLRVGAPDLDAVHGASAGLAHVAYRAAQQHRQSGPIAVGDAGAAPGGASPRPPGGST
jgi:energy-coupling factor transporter ATP-binding protein EcfA2